MTELEKAHARIEELETQEVELCTLYGIAQAENGKLRADLEAIGAGGVSGPLMTPLPGAQPALSAGWVSLPGALPKPGTPVLLDIGNKYPIRAQWVPKDSLEATGDGDFGEYNEASDMYYWPEGWYEWNQYEETHWRVDETPRAWQPLPASPTIEGFTAQAPNQPGGFDAGDMASAAAQGYRDGWTAAQADSAEPAATQPAPHADSVRDYPPLPDFDSDDEPIWNAIFNWKTATPGSEALRKANAVESVISNQLRAYVDADRAARAPADSVTAPAGGVVAYLDIGAGGYLDLGSDLSNEAISRLPKGRHALIIAGTYGIDGYTPIPPAQAADSVLEDAARYRLLRRGQHWSVIDGIGNDLRAEELDAAVDAAMNKGGAT